MLEPLEVLVLFRWHFSTDPMDKVFPFLAGKSSDGSDMGWTHIERVRLDTCDDTNPTFGGPTSLRFEGQDILVLEGLEIDDILALDKPMSPDWAAIIDAGPPSLEESAPVKIPLVGPYLSSLVRMAKWIGNSITTVKHYLNLIGTTLADLWYFDQWVRFYRGVWAKYPEDYSPEGHADFILQVFLIFRWLDPLLMIECRRAVRRYNLVWKYISDNGWERFTNNLRFFPTVYGVVLAARWEASICRAKSERVQLLDAGRTLLRYWGYNGAASGCLGEWDCPRDVL